MSDVNGISEGAGIMSIPKFAEQTGTSEKAVRMMLDKAQLDYVQFALKGTRYINLVKLQKRLSTAPIGVLK